MFFKMEHCDVYYGQIQALYDINVEINPGEIISIIGANGAGKTTLMKSIMGLVPAKNGKIVWQDEEIQAKKTHHIVKRGISYVPEGREIFPGMTVLENMEMGAYTLHMSAKEKADKLNEMYELFPRLYERKKQKAGTLSGGEQQMVAIARGLMLSPKLLMMDEPSLGLAPIIVDEVFDIISRVNEKANIPVLLVEQNAYMALSISHRSYVLENGVIVPAEKPVISAQCLRVPVQDGHTAAVSVKFAQTPTKEQIIERWSSFKGALDGMGLPSAPKKFLTYFTEDDRPQTRLDRDLYGGMGISIGRLREDRIMDYRFVCLSHNTLRGAAGGAVLTAELLCKLGYICHK